MHPAPGHHRGDHPGRRRRLRAGDDVRVEHDQVGGVAGQQAAAPALVAAARRPRPPWCTCTASADGDRLVGVPRPAGRPACGGRRRRSPRSGAQRLDRRVVAEDDVGARVEQLAACGRRSARARPSARRPRRGRSAPSSGCIEAITPSSGEAGQVGVGDALGVLDPRAAARASPTPSRLRANAFSAARLAPSPIACTATGTAQRAAVSRGLGQLVLAQQPVAGAVEHPRRRATPASRP